MNSPLLLSDPRVGAVPVVDNGEPLVELYPGLAGPGVLVRAGLADRLYRADLALPAGLRLHVVEGHRSPRDQQRIIASYGAEVRAAHPDADDAEVRRLTSRFVSPLDVAPHVAGAAVDLTLTDEDGRELNLGTPIDATPEQSGGRCYFAARDIPWEARELRIVLADVLSGAGLVNYPTEWWHWSYGDRYWALMSGAGRAIYGPVEVGAQPGSTDSPRRERYPEGAAARRPRDGGLVAPSSVANAADAPSGSRAAAGNRRIQAQIGAA